MAPPLTFTTSVRGIDAAALAGGFFEAWAAPPSIDEHLLLLHNSTHVALALHGGRVVGFANALSDGVLSAYIPFLEVLPPYRRSGVGSNLVRMLLDALGSLYMVDVMCDEELLPFYETLGFRRAGGAIRRNYDWRSPNTPVDRTLPPC